MDLYWVGGTGNTNDISHYSLTSGGAGGAALPTSSDNVIWDSLSSAVAYSVTVNAAFTCLDFTLGAPLTGKVTFTGSSSMNIAGNVSLTGGSAGITWNWSGAATLSATSAKTFDSNGVPLNNGNFTCNGAGGKWTLQNDLNCVSRDWSVSQGEFDSNSKTITCGFFIFLGTLTRTITLTNSTLNCQGYFVNSQTGLTHNVTGSTINISATSGGGMQNTSGTGLTFNNVTINSTSGGLGHRGANTYANLTLSVNAPSCFHLFTENVTVTTLFTMSGSQSNRIYIGSSTRGTSVIVTAASVSLTDALFEDITGAGAASWTGTRIGNCGGNSGITFTTPVNRYWVGNGGSATLTTKWSTSSGGASGASTPLPQDSAFVDANSISAGGQTIFLDQFRIGNWDFTGVTNSPTVSFASNSFLYGDFKLSSGVGTFSSSVTQTFNGRTQTMNLACGGKVWGAQLVFNMLSTNAAVMLDAVATSTAITHTSGHVNINGFSLQCTTYSITGTGVRSITSGSGGTLFLTGTGTIWNAATTTNLTVTFTGGTIKATDTSATAKTFSGGGKTYGNLWWDCGTGTGNLDNIGSNTFSDYKVTSSTHTLRFTAGTSTTISTWNVNGLNAGSKLTIGSITAASHTLVKSGGGIISSDFLSISRSSATPSSTWYAGANSTDGGNNVGWIFTAAPSSLGNSLFFAGD